MRLINSQEQATKQYMIQKERLNYMTLQESQMSLFEDSEVWTLSVEDFRARLSALRELDEVLKIHEELCSLKSVGSHLFSDLNIYSLKTSEDSSIMTGGATFETIIRTLDGLGYDVEWQILNSKNFGVPQNRERVFIVGHLRGERTRNVFPISGESQSTSTQSVIKIGNVNPSGNGMNGEVYQADGLAPTLTTNKGEGQKIAVKSNTIKQFGVLQPNFNQCGVVYETDGIAPTIRAYQGGGLEPKIIQRSHGYNQGGEHDIAPTLTSNSYHENNVLKITEATSQGYAEAQIGDSVNLSHPNSKTRRGRVGKQIANTLLTGESQGVVEPDFRIRKLTPRECWRLQGFPDWAFDKAKEVNSNSQLYKQAGNSVTVNVIAAIAKELK